MAVLVAVSLGQNFMFGMKNRHHHDRGLLCPHRSIVKGIHIRVASTSLYTHQRPAKPSWPGSCQLFIKLSTEPVIAVGAETFQNRCIVAKGSQAMREPVFAALRF